ncbi:hypothetical protein NDU88_005170 [Pleurodeles waltl]|uniref:Uncharacterized protein n=1 Tax=Pleurodeles waltl TaxID=8319 RepID=A0AAV7UK79_PLEWA|nr:hypothetical protein NDU88_005170 [Pleurodeles waltl]
MRGERKQMQIQETTLKSQEQEYPQKPTRKEVEQERAAALQAEADLATQSGSELELEHTSDKQSAGSDFV